jgi:hypothetical protein
MLVIGDRAIVGIGAPSSQCFVSSFSAYPGGGIGLNHVCQSTPSGTYAVENIKIGNSYVNASFVCCGAGGGGAPNGLGGAAASNTTMKATAGTNGTDGPDGGGGNGGDAENLMGDSQTKNRGIGGIGGKNVTYDCAGHTATSYGGGGGGGAHETVYSTANGGNGGFGSSGTSDVSFVRIYKI